MTTNKKCKHQYYTICRLCKKRLPRRIKKIKKGTRDIKKIPDDSTRVRTWEIPQVWEAPNGIKIVWRPLAPFYSICQMEDKGDRKKTV